MLEFSAQESRLLQKYFEQPWWILDVIATDPQHRRSGLGGALMAPVFERSRAEGVPCFVLTHNPRNVGFCLKYGFKLVIEERLIGPGTPVAYGLERRHDAALGACSKKAATASSTTADTDGLYESTCIVASGFWGDAGSFVLAAKIDRGEMGAVLKAFETGDCAGSYLPVCSECGDSNPKTDYVPASSITLESVSGLPSGYFIYKNTSKDPVPVISWIVMHKIDQNIASIDGFASHLGSTWADWASGDEQLAAWVTDHSATVTDPLFAITLNRVTKTPF